ncbi:MAG: DUF4290 domain-containing protein [Saprospirales bacterium]|jgi:hypothetical protein|nr:DUF4290 domain-containing protein [Saprospirales bacterium]MBK8923506.1 DUF4290 domain-containing protein [Saprospirales bacterium]
MNKIDIEYNTAKKDIRYPEYGRAIQEMLEYAKTIPEQQKRQKAVEAIVGLMQQLNPVGNRNMDDYREKLWNHAFAIAGYDLDVTPPAGIAIRRAEDKTRPERLTYPPTATRLRHYGYNVQTLIKKAIEMPEGPKKEGFVEVIASYMKLAYKTWNREHYVSDDVVKDDLEILSDSQLELHEGHSSLDILAFSANKKDRELQRQHQRNRGKNNGGSSGNKNRNKRNYGNFRKRKK